jgi:bifunctional UDP-N-acetylglucosamine pyrophosphorylase/glucosamine-1-phosphate N-acetyltransferase
MTAATVNRLVDTRRSRNAEFAVLTATIEDPSGYGRVVRKEGDVVAQIVEERDADDATRRIREVNSGFCAFVWGKVLPVLRRIKPSPVSGEYYLTDAVRGVRDEGGLVVAVPMDDPEEMTGVNTPEQFEEVGRVKARQRAGSGS